MSQLASTSAALETHVVAASAAATSADAHANTVSLRAVSISAELASLVQVASLAATSADTHANAASAAATAADPTPILCPLVQSQSAMSLVFGCEFERQPNLEDRSRESVGECNQRQGGSVSAELASLVQIASAAATSVKGYVDAVSSKWAAGSTRGLQSVVNALSSRVDAVTGGA